MTDIIHQSCEKMRGISCNILHIRVDDQIHCILIDELSTCVVIVLISQEFSDVDDNNALCNAEKIKCQVAEMMIVTLLSRCPDLSRCDTEGWG